MVTKHKKKSIKTIGALLITLFVFAIAAQSCSMTTACGKTKGGSKHKKW